MRAFAVVAALLVVAACALGEGLSGSQTPTSVPAPSLSLAATLSPLPTATQATPLPESEWLPPSIMEPILADASARSGVDQQQLVVLRSEAVTWPDGGLGCPQPGVEYPQVQVDGYWVIIEAGGTQYDYRGGGSTDFKLCETAPDKSP